MRGMDSPVLRRTPQQIAGADAEALVTERLSALGWRILGRNLHLGRLEIDLLAVDPGPPANLVVVEVRWRRKRDFGLAEETVDWRKRRRLRAALGRLMEVGRLSSGEAVPPLPIRVDVVAVEPAPAGATGVTVRHHRAAVGG